MVNTREIAAEYRLAHWTQIMRERMSSGLSIRAYCLQVGISKNTYFYWQKKLRETACQELVAHAQTGSPETDNATVPTGWAVCEPALESVHKEKTLPIEINGCRVLADMDTDPELLAKTCKVLIALGIISTLVLMSLC